MKNALTYLTRKCPRACEYCAIRDSRMPGELTPEQWIEAFQILKDLGVTFNLILGNEAWLLGDKLPEIINANKIPYAIYTTAPEPLFSKHVDNYFQNSALDNLSCGVDFPKSEENLWGDDSFAKSQDAWRALEYVREKYPWVDTQATMTVHKLNYKYLPQIVTQAQDLGVFIGINFIHWNKDGGFDFFPFKHEIKELLFETEEELEDLRRVLDEVIALDKGFIQTPEFLKEDVHVLTGMNWHCQGDPYGGPTIDADGTLRVCGYRKGAHTPKFTIWDLKDPAKVEQWREAVAKDASECVGCAWSYPWMTSFWRKKEEEFGVDTFVKHATKKLEKQKWSKRKIE